MAIEIPRSLVEYVLLGPPDDRRQLQDSPILGDVWIAYAQKPDQPRELLITPFKTETAATLATAIDEGARKRERDYDPNIAFLQGVVAARLYFDEVLSIVVPMTDWWHKERIQDELNIYRDVDRGPDRANRAIDEVLHIAKDWIERSRSSNRERLSALDRYVALAGLVLWAGDVSDKSGTSFADALKSVSAQQIADRLLELYEQIRNQGDVKKLVFQVSLNRPASPAVIFSVPAVKGDAARRLFDVKCQDIGWAVIDSGIDGTHPAFRDRKGNSRVLQHFDFTQFRRIVSLGNARDSIRRENLKRLGENRSKLPDSADAILKELGYDAKEGRRIDWLKVERLITLDAADMPRNEHGTHVAGIIGASRKAQREHGPRPERGADGMCPDIKLYDFRVLAPSLEDTEFAIIAALQYIRHLNERHRYFIIHGVNLSLSIKHDVRNYACGRTPVCLECDQMVDNGIVVVAAAGNLGYQSFETRDGLYDGYVALSVTDPGNADGVITVGATHRYSPHTFGVSFFSSRGPTGDGRPKPDLVAPGERIRSLLPGKQWGELDGTSMAAPHVSGAAAMLMARYSELIGQPRRIKRILCGSATDLGRERSFQGHGMLDVLRAFQSI